MYRLNICPSTGFHGFERHFRTVAAWDIKLNNDGLISVLVEGIGQKYVQTSTIRPTAQMADYEIERFLRIYQNKRKLDELGVERTPKAAVKRPAYVPTAPMRPTRHSSRLSQVLPLHRKEAEAANRREDAVKRPKT